MKVWIRQNRSWLCGAMAYLLLGPFGFLREKQLNYGDSYNTPYTDASTILLVLVLLLCLFQVVAGILWTRGSQGAANAGPLIKRRHMLHDESFQSLACLSRR